MVRPAILIVEPEPYEALSVRKLVIETAKFNVLTAYSSKEGQELLELFPNVHAMVVVAEIEDCEQAVAAAKARKPRMPVIFLSPTRNSSCGRAEHHLSSHEPQALVDLLRQLFGDPRKAA